MSERRPAALPLRAEIGRQLRRRRTQGIFIVLTVLPLILVLAFWLGDDDSDSGQLAAHPEHVARAYRR